MPNAQAAATLIQSFHELWYESRIWDNEVTWRGVPCQKCPLDLWRFQQIITTIRPALIVELGTAAGGTTLFLADMLNLVNPAGKVMSVDIVENCRRPAADRIVYVSGRSSVDVEVLDEVRRVAAGVSPVMVIADSDHAANHVLVELRQYSPLVSVGSYFIVEDTNLNGHPVIPSFGHGPAEAVDIFLNESPNFVQDTACERFLLTFNPGGYLRRVY